MNLTRPLSRRSYLAGAGLTTATLAAAGCGVGNSSTGSGSTASQQPATVQMHFQSAGAPGEWDAITKAFRAKYPHLTIEFNGIENADDFVQKGLALAAGGTPPDISGGNPRFHMAFFNAGALLDMNDVVKRERLDLREIPKNLMDDPAWKGKQLMLPAVFEPAVVFYNKTLFDRAGRPDPAQLWAQKKWTWQAFVDTILGLNASLGAAPVSAGGGTAIAYQMQTWDGELFSVVRSAGADVLNADRNALILDQPAGVEALAKWVELSARHKAATPALPLPQGGFNSGLVGMRLGVGSQIPGIRDALKKAQANVVWDAVPIPVDRSQTPALFVGGYALWKGAKHAGEAVAFLKYLLTDEPMLLRAELGGRMPSRAKLLPEFGKRLNIPGSDPKNLVKAVEETLPGGKGLPHTPTFTVWRDILDKQVLIPAQRGDVAVRDALAAAKPAITAELQKGA